MRLLVLLLVATGAAAESFPIGRTDLAAAPENRWSLRGASNGSEHLAVWVDGPHSYDGELWATRLSSDGKPLDGEGR